jgi:Skp family chaperone for outer membrane proteins
MKNTKNNPLVTFAIVAGLVSLGILAGMIIAPVRAQSTYANIGFVDIKKALDGHPRKQAVFDQIHAFEQAKMDELAALQAQTNMTDQQRQQLMEKLYQSRDEIDAERQRLTAPLIQDVIDATNAIGQESGIEVILEGGSVMYGGLDLTPLVIQRLTL